MTYLAEPFHPRLHDAFERPTLCTLEAAIAAAQDALRRRHPDVDFWSGFPADCPAYDQIAAHILFNRLSELRDLIALYDAAIVHAADQL